MPALTAEQRVVVDAVGTRNVIVDSVAGSGKTTTILHIAERYPGLNVLVLTYNTHLRHETITKSQQRGLRNAEIHTYHSFVSRYLSDGVCQNDALLHTALESVAPQEPYAFDIVVLDEAQDMEHLLYRTSQAVFAHNAVQNPRICVVGDVWQSIYQYKGSDPRYITEADTRFAACSNRSWVRLNLTRTFRLTRPMCAFVNRAMIGEDRLWSDKDGASPRYWLSERYPTANIVDDIFAFKNQGYKDDDFFIIAPSVLPTAARHKPGKEKPGNSPVNAVENLLKQRGCNLFVKMTDDGSVSEDIIRNKMVITTMHGSKGLERPIVYVMNFDAGYFTFIARDSDPTVCPNVWYVAATRASRHLVLIHNKENTYMPFLDRTALDETADARDARANNAVDWVEPPYTPPKPRDAHDTVMMLLSHLSFDVMHNAMRHLAVTRVDAETGDGDGDGDDNDDDGGETIVFSPSVSSKVPNSKELVADVMGIAIPYHYARVYVHGRDLAIESAAFRATLQHTVNRQAKHSGYLFKERQIKHYNWIKNATLQKLMRRMHRLRLLQGAEYYEHPIVAEAANHIEFRGSTDYMDDERMVEFKCVSALSDVHFLQVALYAYIMETNAGCTPSPLTYQLFNILTNELYTIAPATPTSLCELYMDLVRYHGL